MEFEVWSLTAISSLVMRETVALQKAIHSLPPKQQAVFNMRYYDEMSFREIADANETTESSAKANYHFAKAKIIEQMKRFVTQ